MYDMELIQRLLKNTIQLTREQELDLWNQFWDGKIDLEKIGDRMIRANIKFIYNVARQYIGTSKVSFQDLVCEGIMGYCEALPLYERGKSENKFNSFAVYWIKARISEHIEKHSFQYKIPHNKAQEIRTATRLQKEYNARKLAADIAGIEFTEKEYVFPKDLSKVINDTKNVFSLDCQVNDSQGNSTTFADSIECTKATQDMSTFEEEDLKEFLRGKINELSKIEQLIVKTYFGFYDELYDEVITFKELAAKTGIKYNQLSTIKDNAIQKLKTQIKPELSR
jgi:RNA polymerase sigma factor (sigma-70 family)